MIDKLRYNIPIESYRRTDHHIFVSMTGWRGTATGVPKAGGLSFNTYPVTNERGLRQTPTRFMVRGVGLSSTSLGSVTQIDSIGQALSSTPTREGTFGFCEGPRFIFDKSWTAKFFLLKFVL